MNREYIAKKVAEYADKYDLTDVQAIRVLYNVIDIKNMWGIADLDEYLLDTAPKYDIEL